MKADSVYENNAAYKPGNVLDGNPDTYWAHDNNSSSGSLMIDLGKEKTFDIVVNRGGDTERILAMRRSYGMISQMG